MSARSSYDSWAGRDHAADIIDLDRYMRGGVRPQVRRRDDCDRLVVDAGGSTAVSGGPLVGSLAGSARVPSPLHKSSTSTASAPRDKRYSHDSGLSDGSYSRRRTHRRVMGENATMRAHRERERGRERTVKLSNSMRNFHATYERALRDQQDQIARVAELCERLTKNMNNERSGTAATTVRKQSVSCTQDSSDISSSSISRSTRATKSQKDKHRTNECKTYKIIMNKLDELNRLFAVRARPVPATRRTPSLRPCAAPPGASSVTVSVSDKLVYTDPHLERKDKEHNKSSKNSPRLEEHGVAGKRSRRAIIARLATTRAHDVDIAPAKTNGAASPDKMRSGCINVATENVMECDTEGGDSVAESLCKFDLDNPLHFYHQAKHLQSPLNKTSTVHSINYCNIRTNANERNHVHTNYVSLCHRCQGYWKTLTDLVYHLFNRNDSTSSKSYVR